MKITADTCRLLRGKLDAAIATITIEGLTLKVGKCTYDRDGNFATFKLEVAATGDSGVVMTKEAARYEQCASMLNLPKDGLGKTYKLGGIEYKITGINSTLSKLIVERTSDRKTYLFKVEAAARYMKEGAVS